MINWNEVTVGETEICRGSFHNRKVMGMCDPWVWLYDQTSAPSTYHKDDLHTWAVYNPWEEITEECRWVKSPGSNYEWIIYHNGKAVEFDNPNFKSTGRRVWKRKEG